MRMKNGLPSKSFAKELEAVKFSRMIGANKNQLQQQTTNQLLSHINQMTKAIL
uniref:Uncharacterized protein n=1 Tax=Rhizophora mucronata TaxID=61149 RepID=A0A2P2QKR9_RHIMU